MYKHPKTPDSIEDIITDVRGYVKTLDKVNEQERKQRATMKEAKDVRWYDGRILLRTGQKGVMRDLLTRLERIAQFTLNDDKQTVGEVVTKEWDNKHDEEWNTLNSDKEVSQ